MFAGSEFERYVRYLQLLRDAQSYPWEIRAFSPAELDRILEGNTSHPWQKHYSFAPDTSHGPRWSVIPIVSTTYYNSQIPYGTNDGPVWAGRGFTYALQGGVTA